MWSSVAVAMVQVLLESSGPLAPALIKLARLPASRAQAESRITGRWSGAARRSPLSGSSSVGEAARAKVTIARLRSLNAARPSCQVDAATVVQHQLGPE
jgi:hypothetical protein